MKTTNLLRATCLAAVALSAVPALHAQSTVFTEYTGDNYRYWNGLTTSAGTFRVYFGEWISYDSSWAQTSDFVIDSSTAENQAFLRKFSESVMRALNTIESTFVSNAKQEIKINVSLNVRTDRSPGAAADPQLYARSNASGAKKTWTESDFGGKYAGEAAYINDLEMLYKYGVYYSSAPRSVDLNFYSRNNFSELYVEEDASGYTNGLYDVETITLHEMGHALGFQSNLNPTVIEGKSALEMLSVSEQSELQGGGLRWYFTGETATYVNGGERVEFMPGASVDEGHIIDPASDLMADGTYNPGAARAYSLLDLAIFQDLGWELKKPIVIPEPSALGLLAGGGALVFVLTSRRRRRSRE